MQNFKITGTHGFQINTKTIKTRFYYLFPTKLEVLKTFMNI